MISNAVEKKKISNKNKITKTKPVLMSFRSSVAGRFRKLATTPKPDRVDKIVRIRFLRVLISISYFPLLLFLLCLECVGVAFQLD